MNDSRTRNVEHLKKILEKHGYKLVKITRFRRTDRVKVECSYGFLTVNYRRHLEDFTVRELCDGLLTREQQVKEFGCEGCGDPVE